MGSIGKEGYKWIENSGVTIYDPITGRRMRVGFGFYTRTDGKIFPATEVITSDKDGTPITHTQASGSTRDYALRAGVPVRLLSYVRGALGLSRGK